MTKSSVSTLAEQDLRAIHARRIDISNIRFQREHLTQQKAYIELDRPATLGDGIEQLPSIANCERFSAAADEGRLSAFVPASGDATRMFDSLFRMYLENTTSESSIEQRSKAGDDYATEALKTLRRIQDFALWIDLESIGCSPNDWPQILEAMFSPDHLALNRWPKGLIPFHMSGSTARTAIEEHCFAALNLGFRRLHFTIKRDFIEEFNRKTDLIRSAALAKFNEDIEIGYSFQHSNTDTIALCDDGEILRDNNGCIVFRAGGHGSLLSNLMEMSGDIVFLKNIDNIAVGKKSSKINDTRRILCEILLKTEERVHSSLKKLNSNGDISDAIAVLTDDFGLSLPVENQPSRYYIDQLNRPIRVCGVIRNRGDIGGGPFWTKANGTAARIQIVESAELLNSSEDQTSIWKTSTHFNPVDIVCSIRDFEGSPFNLFNFRDENAVILTRKSKNGNSVFAYEHPGLWNGGMAHWNSIFVEVPAETFHPVKYFSDLLNPYHRDEI